MARRLRAERLAAVIVDAGPKQLLARFGLRAKKAFGQNFLADANVARRIAEIAVPEPGGSVIEIGAGLGALTGPLLARVEYLAAVERDRDLVSPLRELFAETAPGRFDVIEADAKTVAFDALWRGRPEPHRLAGNLPYQLTGPLTRRFCEFADRVERVTVLVQLEVAARFCAEPSTPAYGALSVFVQAAFEARREMVVRRGAFYPQPRVDSALVTLKSRAVPVARETSCFRALVLSAFSQRRKTLRNAWRSGGLPGLELLGNAAARAGIDLERRGETLAVSDFARMAALLEEAG
ncbi:MAG TPA: 16S rRNA (adenine(1518)-N(6)/adenine(1519)-N(6))-dimethyltransferase RsmA [Polyangiaceae bacterium]